MVAVDIDVMRTDKEWWKPWLQVDITSGSFELLSHDGEHEQNVIV